MERRERRILIDRLSSPDEEVRRRTMEHLKQDVAGDDLDWLVAPLSDESWRVRKEAIEGLSSVGPDRDLLERLFPMLDSSMDPTLRNSVAEILERMGREAIPFLLARLRTESADVRKFLVDILGNIADPSSVPGLVTMLGDADDNVRAAASEALAAAGDPSVSGVLIAALEDSDDWVSFSILGALARLRYPDALPVFFRYLEHPTLSKPAISGIGQMGAVEDGIRLLDRTSGLSRGAVKAVLPAVAAIYRRTSRHGDVRAAESMAARVTGLMDEGLKAFFIGQLAISESIETRRDLITVLAMIADEASLQAVLAHVDEDDLAVDLDLAVYTMVRCSPSLLPVMLRHPDHLVRRKAVQTIEKMEDPRLLQHLIPMVGDKSGHVRKDAIRAVSAIGREDSMAVLIPALDDEYGDVAQSAAEALVRLGRRYGSAVEAAIRPLLEGADPGAKALMLGVLARTDVSGWLGMCLAAAKDPQPVVRAAAVSCLLMSRDAAAVGTLLGCLEDENPEVRVRAVEALQEIRPAGALEPLRAAMDDRDARVRAAAVMSFGVQPGAGPEDLERFLVGDDILFKTAVIDALGRMAAEGRDEAVGILERTFHEGGPEIKRSVCRALGEIPGSAAEGLLRSAMGDRDSGIRLWAVQALGQRRPSDYSRSLAEMAENDPDAIVREAARSLLGAGR